MSTVLAIEIGVTIVADAVAVAETCANVLVVNARWIVARIRNLFILRPQRNLIEGEKITVANLFLKIPGRMRGNSCFSEKTTRTVHVFLPDFFSVFPTAFYYNNTLLCLE